MEEGVLPFNFLEFFGPILLFEGIFTYGSFSHKKTPMVLLIIFFSIIYCLCLIDLVFYYFFWLKNILFGTSAVNHENLGFPPPSHERFIVRLC